MKPLTSQVGGKTRLAKWIVSHFPSQDCYRMYVEPFGGSAAILLYEERPSIRELYNDINGDLVNMLQIARLQPEEMKAQLDLVPYSRGQYREWRRDYFSGKHQSLDPLERAVRWFTIQRQAFSGWISPRNAGFQVPSRPDQAWHPCAFRSAIDRIPEIAKRLSEVVIENLPFEDVLCRSDLPESCVYLDPPYSPRRLKHVESGADKGGNEYYCVQWREEDDWKLAAAVCALRGRVIISGYAGDHFTQLFPPPLWRYVYKTVNVTCTNIHHHRDRAATEALAMNYDNGPGYPRRLGGLE